MVALFKLNVEKLEANKDTKGLIKALSYKDSDVRKRAVELLGKIGGKRARAVGPPPFRASNDEWRVRAEAAEALGRIVDAGAVEPLIQALKDEDSNVRKTAVKLLGKIVDARAVEPLSLALEDENKYVRSEAAAVLVKIGDKGAVEPLILALKDEYWLVQSEAAEALGKIGDARAVEPLSLALEDENKYVRREAAAVLGKIGDKSAVEPLIQALKDEDSNVRREAAGALGKIGDARAVEPLILALKDEACNFQREAAGALVKMGDKKAAKGVIDWLFIPDGPQPYKDWGRLFGDYTCLIFKAVSVGYDFEITGITGRCGRYSYPLDESNEAIEKLCKIISPISTNILHKVATKKDIRVEVSFSCAITYYGTLSFEQQREMAKEELKQRGNPPYDPSAYLDEEAWKV